MDKIGILQILIVLKNKIKRIKTPVISTLTQKKCKFDTKKHNVDNYVEIVVFSLKMLKNKMWIVFNVEKRNQF